MIIESHNLKELRQKLKDKKIVLALGCFDLLHGGHLQYLKKAAALGDILVVHVANNERVKLLKGEDRPLIDLRERMEIIDSLRFVDYVTSHPEVKSDIAVEEILKTLRPDIFANGSDKRNEKIKKISPNTNIVIIPELETISTTKILNKLGLS